MKKFIIFISFLTVACVAPTTTFSQGFDWSLSPRLPQEHSSLFFGSRLSYGIGSEFGKFDFFEDDCNCGAFRKGESSTWSLAVESEYWLSDGLSALNTGISYTNLSPEFAAYSSLPILIDGVQEEFIDYKNSYSSELSYINIFFGAKRRLFETHFSVSASINLGLLTSHSQKHYEEIVGPDWAPPFNTSPPSYKRVVSDSEISKLRGITLFPTISINYDFSLATGYYSSIGLQYRIPFLNMVSDGNWRHHSLSVNVSVFRWF